MQIRNRKQNSEHLAKFTYEGVLQNGKIATKRVNRDL